MHVPAYPVKVRDVSGAGDTVVAVARASCWRRGADFEVAMRAANAAAAVVVGKRGTATVSAAELRAAHPARRRRSPPEEKIVFDWRVLDERLAEWRRARACASASPTAASICCIPATSSCWPQRARPATGWWSASTAMPR